MLENESYYHVITRGNNKMEVFHGKKDFKRYLWCLGFYKNTYPLKLHHYCLMTNHVHLLIRNSQKNSLSQFMLCLNTVYSRYFNKRHQRVGHLFQGPYDERLIKQDTQLLIASRYIHRNPVKAELCKTPQNYVWSSYRAYISKHNNPLDLIDTELILSLSGLKDSLRTQIDNYRYFVETFTLPADDWKPEEGRSKRRLRKRSGLSLHEQANLK